MLDELHPQHWVWTLQSPSEPHAGAVRSPHIPLSGTRANPWWHRDSSLGLGPSRDGSGGVPGRQAPFTAPRHWALSLPGASHALPWAPGSPAGMGRGQLAEGAGVATGLMCLLDAVSSAGAAWLLHGEGRCISLHPACFPQQRAWGEGLLSLGFPKVHSVPASLTGPGGTDSLEEFISVLLWGI